MSEAILYTIEILFLLLVIGYWIADICFWNAWKIGYGKLIFGVLCILLPNFIGVELNIVVRIVLLFLGSTYVEVAYFKIVDGKNN